MTHLYKLLVFSAKSEGLCLNGLREGLKERFHELVDIISIIITQD